MAGYWLAGCRDLSTDSQSTATQFTHQKNAVDDMHEADLSRTNRLCKSADDVDWSESLASILAAIFLSLHPTAVAAHETRNCIVLREQFVAIIILVIFLTLS